MADEAAQPVEVRVALVERDQAVVWRRIDEMRDDTRRHHTEDDDRFNDLARKVDALREAVVASNDKIKEQTTARFDAINTKYLVLLGSLVTLCAGVLVNVIVQIVIK